MGAREMFGWVVRRVGKHMSSIRIRGRGLEKLKRLESIRVKTYDRLFAQRLKKVYQGFPSIEELPEYLRELLELKIGIDRIKLGLGRIKGSLRALESIRDDVLFKIRKARTPQELRALRKQYLARVFEVLESLEKDLSVVSRARRELKRTPPVRSDRPVVVLAGFPNAGKSSLLKALTGSEPEIAPYPFTTKRIMIGHFSDGYRLIQVLDTPGILDRPVENMKPEEKDALLSMKHLADLVVFLVDPFQDLKSQANLLRYLKSTLQKPLIVAVGKSDLLDKREPLEGFEQDLFLSPLTGEGVEELKNLLIRRLEGIKW